MAVYQRGRIWWIEFQFLGSRVRESSNSANKALAQRLEREWRRELELGTGNLEEIRRPKMFASVAREWGEGNPHWSKSTREIAELKLKRLLPVFGRKLINMIKPKDVAAYQRQRQEEGASARTINMEISALRQILREQGRWAYFDGKVKMLRESEEVGRALTDDEIYRIEAAAAKSRSRSLPVAITILRHTGMRVSELRTMQWHQVDFLAKQLRVGKAKTKGSEGRVIPLSEIACKTLLNWRGRFPSPLPEHYIFPSERYGLDGEDGFEKGEVAVWNIQPEKPIGSWKTAWTACRNTAGVKCRLHDLRHTFVSKLAEAQVADSTLMALTGHMSKKMQERYSHVRNQAKRNAIALFDGELPKEDVPTIIPQ